MAVRLLGIAAVILIAAGCAPSGLVAGRADISGGPLGIGERTRPASGADLTILSDTGRVSHADVDRRGRFHVRLAPGHYRIWVTGWPHDHPTRFTVRPGRTTPVTMHLAVR